LVIGGEKLREKDYVISSVVATISMENNFSLKSLFLVPLSAIVFGGIVASVDMSPSSLTLQVGAITPIQATLEMPTDKLFKVLCFNGYREMSMWRRLTKRAMLPALPSEL